MTVVAMSLFRFLFIAFAALAASAAAAEADPCLKEDYAEANCAPRRRTTPILRTARAHCRGIIHNHAARPQFTEPARYCPTADGQCCACLLYTSPSPRDGLLSRMPSSA